MQQTIDITPGTILELRWQLIGKRCVVISLVGTGADQAYLLNVQGETYRITRNDVRTLLNHRQLPGNIAIPIIDYALENGIFEAKHMDDDGDMVFWI